jgi:hypothetical protein
MRPFLYETARRCLTDVTAAPGYYDGVPRQSA